MYATNVKGQVINLAVSGKLWKRALVMVDEETETLWSQLLAKGMQGELKDTELEILPSVITDWKSWLASHPDTTVLRLTRTARRFNRDMYRDPKKFVIGISKPSQSKAWSFEHLMETPLVNDSFSKKPIVVFFRKSTGAAYLYERNLDGTDLSFEMVDGQIRDKGTSSVWNMEIGQATEGPLKDKSLKPMPAIPSFLKSWRQFYPDSDYWAPK